MAIKHFSSLKEYLSEQIIGQHALVPSGQEYGKFFRALKGKSLK